jgi:hypothetical protein
MGRIYRPQVLMTLYFVDLCQFGSIKKRLELTRRNPRRSDADTVERPAVRRAPFHGMCLVSLWRVVQTFKENLGKPTMSPLRSAGEKDRSIDLMWEPRRSFGENGAPVQARAPL